MLTAEEFATKMQEIKDKYGADRETVHVKMDNLMCELLKELGYGKGVEIFNNTDMWYC